MRSWDGPTTSRAAAVVDFDQPLEIIDVPSPDELEPGSVLVETTAATVCATDLHVWHGRVSDPEPASMLPLILGHEMTGRIARLGPGVSRDSIGETLDVGDRIVWTHGFCGSCRECVVEHRPTLCTNRRAYMATTCRTYPYLTGAFSQYGYVFPSSGRIKVPENVSNVAASAASCAFRTVMHGYAILGPVEPSKTILIQGSGPLGLFATARATAADPERLIVVGGPADRLELARAWGATHTIDVTQTPEPADRISQVADLTSGRGADVIIEVSGARTAFSEAVAMLARGGSYLLMGQVRANPHEFDASGIVLKQARILGSLSGSAADYYAALSFMSRHAARFDWDRMVPNRYPLAQVNQALLDMENQRSPKPAIDFAL
jgi:D-arabinose 1-dehydrogenase-like Zn-dependent alcohol dehydrogenase